jgi:hypothetical protein
MAAFPLSILQSCRLCQPMPSPAIVNSPRPTPWWPHQRCKNPLLRVLSARKRGGIRRKCKRTECVRYFLRQRGNSGDIYEQAIVKPVPSHGSEQALSLSRGRSRDFFAGIPHLYSASPGSGRQGNSGEILLSSWANRWISLTAEVAEVRRVRR